MTDSSYSERSRQQYESKLLQNQGNGTNYQFLRHKIDNQINSRLMSPPSKDNNEIYRRSQQEDSKRVLSPNSIQERFVGSSHTAAPPQQRASYHLNDSKEGYSKPPLYLSPPREFQAAKNGGADYKQDLSSEIGKAQREQRKKDIWSKIQQLDEKLNSQSNSKNNNNQGYSSSSVNNMVSSTISHLSNSSNPAAVSAQIDRNSLQQVGAPQTNSALNFNRQRGSFKQGSQNDENENASETFDNSKQKVESYKSVGLLPKQTPEDSKYSQGQSNKYFAEGQGSKYSSEALRSQYQSEIQGQKQNGDANKNLRTGGAILPKNSYDNIRNDKEQSNQVIEQKQKTLNSETSPRSQDANELSKLKSEIQKLESSHLSLKQQMEKNEKQHLEAIQKLQEQVKQGQQELSKSQEALKKETDAHKKEADIHKKEADAHKKEAEVHKKSLQDETRKREIVELEKTACQEALEEQTKDMEDALQLVKSSYEEKLLEFEALLNESNERIQEIKDSCEDPISKAIRENPELLQMIENKLAGNSDQTREESNSNNDESTQKLKREIELKDTEIMKMNDVIEQFKILLNHLNEEKSLLIGENQNVSEELEQYKAYFIKIFGRLPNDEEDQQNQDEQEGEEGDEEEQGNYEEYQDGEQNDQYEEGQEYREDDYQGRVQEEDDEDHLTGEQAEGMEEQDDNNLQEDHEGQTYEDDQDEQEQ